MKAGDVGLVGLMGINCCCCCTSDWMYLAQSPKLYRDSSVARNHSFVEPVSLLVISPVVRLDRRFRNLSVAGSGEICIVRVGRR